jgi:RES domain-containing protein
MIPDPAKVGEGRLNPKGIAYIYLADNLSAAIYEMRPWIGDILSVAHFVSLSELRIVDLTSDTEESIKMKKFSKRPLPSSKKDIERQIWADLNRAFSKPVDPDTNPMDYVPTQIIAEWIKRWGFDGVKYKSSVHPTGMNFVLFNRNIFTEMESCDLHTIESLKYERHGTNDELTRYSERLELGDF